MQMGYICLQVNKEDCCSREVQAVFWTKYVSMAVHIKDEKKYALIISLQAFQQQIWKQMNEVLLQTTAVNIWVTMCVPGLRRHWRQNVSTKRKRLLKSLKIKAPSHGFQNYSSTGFQLSALWTITAVSSRNINHIEAKNSFKKMTRRLISSNEFQARYYMIQSEHKDCKLRLQ